MSAGIRRNHPERRRLRSAAALVSASVLVSGFLAGCSQATSSASRTSTTITHAGAAAGRTDTHNSAPSAASSGTASSGSASTSATPTPFSYSGKLTKFEVTGPVSHRTGVVYVWTPPSYDSGKGTYPAIMGLHGWPGTPRMVYQNIKLLDAATRVSSEHQVAEPVLVMPQWGDVDTECTDSDAAHMSETWLSVDLPAWTEAHFRVRAGAQNWATLGFSAGAYCASMLAMRHPDVFGAGVSLSGYSQVWWEPGFQPFTPTSPRGQDYDLALIAEHRTPKVSIYLLTDTADNRSYPSTKRLIDAARPPLNLHTVYGEGGHSVSLWIPQTRDSLAWLGQTLSGFRPS